MAFVVSSFTSGVQGLWSLFTSEPTLQPNHIDSINNQRSEEVLEKPGSKKQQHSELKDIIKQSSACSTDEISRANQVKKIHNIIEEIAYKGFAEKVIQLGITQDAITEKQSGEILTHIKAVAHIELYKEGGYATERFKLLDSSQVKKIVANVAKIVHDRDTKLTNARYFFLSELLMGLDDHNTMVKEILLESWYKCSRIEDCQHSHLERIKEKIDFYGVLNQQLEFNLRESLEDRKIFWQKYFPSLRVASQENSVQFMNVIDVRHYFGDAQLNYDAETCTLSFDTENFSYEISHVNLDAKLVTVLNEKDAQALFAPRTIFNYVRNTEVKAAPFLSNENMTIHQFLTAYFPEKL